MKVKSIILLIIIAIFLIEISGIILFNVNSNLGSYSLYAYTDGSPAACTGSPSDKKTCASSNCHIGTARMEHGWISSNIPTSGYEFGKIYTITLTAKGSAVSKRFGFQVSPQDSLGKLAGTMIVKDAEQTKLTDKGKYLTQLPDGVDGNVNKTWTFDWKAPSINIGKIVFYACFVISGKPECTVTSWYEIHPKL